MVRLTATVCSAQYWANKLLAKQMDSEIIWLHQDIQVTRKGTRGNPQYVYIDGLIQCVKEGKLTDAIPVFITLMNASCGAYPKFDMYNVLVDLCTNHFSDSEHTCKVPAGMELRTEYCVGIDFHPLEEMDTQA